MFPVEQVTEIQSALFVKKLLAVAVSHMSHCNVLFNCDIIIIKMHEFYCGQIKFGLNFGKYKKGCATVEGRSHALVFRSPTLLSNGIEGSVMLALAPNV